MMSLTHPVSKLGILLEEMGFSVVQMVVLVEVELPVVAVVEYLVVTEALTVKSVAKMVGVVEGSPYHLAQ